MEEEVLVKVDGVSKKFSKDLKKSLKYGLQDIVREVFGKPRKKELRPSEFLAVNQVSFELKRGECLGLIGHNGAGKSTLLKILNGLLKPDEGRVEIRGRVAALIELGAGFNPVLTGRENIYNNASVLGFTKEETDAKLEEIIEFSELREFIDAPVQSYSSGMKVRLGFAVAAQMEPDVLIIDEVLAVGDLGFRTKCINRINEMLHSSAVIFVSHAMPLVARTVTTLLFLDKGEIKYQGDDIHTGIEIYLNLFEKEQERIVGSGIARASDLKLNKKEYQFGDQITLSGVVKLEKKVRYNIVIIVKNRDLVQVASIYSRADLAHFENEGNINLVFNNYFTPGKYLVNFGIVESSDFNDVKPGEVYFMHENALEFSSEDSNVFSHVPVRIEGTWSLDINNND